VKWFVFAFLVSVCGMKTFKAQAQPTQLPEAP
jgi:hypothetical protein